MAIPLNKLRQTVYKVFYRDYVRDEVVSSIEPTSMLGEKIPELAQQVLQHADNFIGIYDQNDTILQAYLDDDEQQVEVELIYPEGRGEYSRTLSYDEAFNILQSLPPIFNKDLLQA